MKSKEVIHAEQVAEAIWGSSSYQNAIKMGIPEHWHLHTAYWSTGTTLHGHRHQYPQEIPIQKSGRSTYKCIRCGKRIVIDFDRTEAVFVLKCPSCGSNDVEKIE